MEKIRERNVYHLSRIRQFCYRQEKYPKENDVRRQCSWGYKEISNMCFNCKWLENKHETTLQASGKESEDVANFIRHMMTTEVGPQKQVKDKAIPIVEVEVRSNGIHRLDH